jgi:aryl-alcohol dehydrogenase-like predicted oxidoreductase
MCDVQNDKGGGGKTHHGALSVTAWLMARPSVTVPIASAVSTRQLSDILKAVDLELRPEDFAPLGPSIACDNRAKVCSSSRQH